MSRITAAVCAALLIFAFLPVVAAARVEVPTDAQSYVLMDAGTGAVIAEKEADKPLPCASVVKTLSLLLFMRAMDEGRLNTNDNVNISRNAAKKGGTSVFLDEGGSYKAGDLLEAVVINSANDACVALAEHIAGSEEEFVNRMNAAAKDLGLTGSKFCNATGLDAEGQVTTARDMAQISRELVKHPMFFKWSTVWMDDFAHEGGRKTEMVNSNRLVRYYDGCDGIKTGSSAKAGYCLTATAKRSNGRFIYVCLNAGSSESRFEGAQKAFDLAFSNYASKAIVRKDDVIKENVPVDRGDKPLVNAYAASDLNVLVPKGQENAIRREAVIEEPLLAPLEAGQIIGRLIVTLDGAELGNVDIICKQPVLELEYLTALQKLLFWWLN